MNLFEGARRIAKIFAGLWVLGCIGYVFTIEPHISTTYAVSAPNQTPRLMMATCPDDAAIEPSWDLKTKKGNAVYVALCFLPSLNFDDAKTPLVPFIAADGKMYGSEKYSSGVAAYTKEVMKNFSIPIEDHAALDAQAREKWWAAFWIDMQFLVGGLIFIYGVTWCVGYVVRGFMRVPKGSDKKIEKDQNDK
jgi:hypothetical protein